MKKQNASTTTTGYTLLQLAGKKIFTEIDITYTSFEVEYLQVFSPLNFG